MPPGVKLALNGVLVLAALVVITYAAKYRSWPLVVPPKQVVWCGATWERENEVERSSAPAQLYPVSRQPPLIGTRFYSPYPPAERRRLDTGIMAEACGGILVARDGDRLISYVKPG